MEGVRRARAGVVAVLATGALLAFAAVAQAQRPPTLGEGSPLGQNGIQLFNFSGYLNNGAGEINPPAPPTTAGRLERVFQFLQAQGVKNVELYGYPGNPFPGTNPATPLNVAGLQALRALGDQYGIHFMGRHGNLTEANWDNHIAAAKILGQDHVGEAGFPGGNAAFNTYAATLNTAQVLNRLGKRSVEAGLGPAYFHNHQPEFATRYVDDGVLKSAWEIVMDRTDPRWVSAQIDIGWAVCGAAGHANPVDPAVGEAYVTAMINKFQRRIVSFHVKDVVDPRPTCGNNDQRELGLGDIDFAPMFVASKNRVKYYLAERDPVAIGGPTNFNPFTNTANSLASLKSAPAPVLYAYPPTFLPVAANTVGAPQTVTVTNDGDAPLTFTGNPVTLAANADDGGTQTANDFQIVSTTCAAATPLAPGESCTVNVAFRPSRTNYTSVARLQFNSNSDDAMERVLLAAKSSGDAVKTIGGDVPSLLQLSIPGTGGSFGTFVPAVARTYDTALAAVVTATTADAALSVTDNSTAAPGHLVNGSFSLPSPITARAVGTANPGAPFVPLPEVAGQPTQLFSWSGPVTSEPLTLGFRQSIGALDVLRAGTYSKTLTFTLSTTTP